MDNPFVIILIFLIIALVIFAALGLKVVRHAETVVIERLGRFHRLLESGINIIWPIIDRSRPIYWRYIDTSPDGLYNVVVNKQSTRIDLRETVYDFPKQNVITADNVNIEINALVYFQIIDAMKAVYEINNLPNAIEKLTQTTLRNVIGEMDLDGTLTSRDTINKKLGIILDEATNKWGVKVNRVEIQDINPPADIQQAMEKQMRAERDRRAIILEAEGKKTAQILEAEGAREAAILRADGEKEADILRADGEAAALERMAQAEGEAITRVKASLLNEETNAASYLIAMRYVETLKEMTSGKDNKTVYMPYEATNLLGALGGVKDLFKGS
jgi:regulator of protease activity HflC (stomatin/prohibitin superfamily)